MTTFRRQILVKMFMLLDPTLLTMSYVVAAIQVLHLTELNSVAAFLSMRVKLMNVLVFLALFCSWHLIFSAFGLYESRRLGDRKEEAVAAAEAVSACAIVLAVVATVFRARTIAPSLVLIFWIVATVAVVISRIALREFLKRVRKHGRNLHQLLIVGTNSRAVEFAHVVAGRPELGYHLVGFADEEWTRNREFGKNGESIVCDLKHFSSFLRERVIDEVAIALPMKSFYSEAARIVGVCHQQGVVVRVLANLFEIEKGWVNSGQIQGMAVATFSSHSTGDWPMVCKRLLDLCISSLLLASLIPLFLIVGILIKWDSAGPVVFIQERVGLNKRRFRMCKFRTMVDGAEKRLPEVESLNEVDGPVFKIRNDPRITRLGRFLRRASIDELPQLLNVFMGDMSLVGPRPLDVRDYNGLDEDWLRRRFSVRPGMTCLWQVNGRSSVSFQKWMELDMEYIDNWSLGLDFKILAKTIPAVLKGAGAA